MNHPPIETIARGLVRSGPWILLCRAIKAGKPGYCYLPGGHIEPSESARASLQREFLEECGLRVRIGELAWVSESRFVTRRRAHHEIVLTFHVEPPRRYAGASAASPPPPVESREPKIAFEWARPRDLVTLDFRPRSHLDYLIGTGRKGEPRGGSAAFLSDMA